MLDDHVVVTTLLTLKLTVVLCVILKLFSLTLISVSFNITSIG